ncbi:MAG: PAS domain S-box protein [Nitrospirota bacterium]
MSSIDHLSEIDSLRSQVAELERTLAERDRSMQDLREHRHLLRTIAEGTAVETGDAFFASLVTHLTSTLPVQYAAIGEVLGDQPKKIRTLAVSTAGALIDNFEYDLAHTPCAVALSQTFTCFARDVQATFPQFHRLADLGAESYCAVPLWTKDRGVIGLLVVMDTKPLTTSDDLRSLLKVFAPRVTAELERRRAKQEYVQALTDVRNVMDTVPDILFTLDNQGRLVKWNRRLGDVTGYSPEELLHKPALTFVPPEEQTRTAAAIQRAFTEGYAELDGHLLTKEQRLIPYHWTGALLRNPHGKPIGITGVGQDVTEKKRTEEALQESETRYRILSEATFDGIGIHDQGILIEVNPGLEKMFGYGPGELIGKNFLDMVADESREMVIANMRMGASGPYESVGRRKDGSTFYGEVVVKYHRYQGREVRLVAGRDITKRKRAEEALARREQELRIVLDALPVGVWFTDARGKIVLSNPAARKIWTSVKQVSMSDTEMDAQWWKRTDSLDEPHRWALTRALVKGESTYNDILEIECQDGSRKIVSNSAVPVHGAHGSLLGAILLNEDITMLRRTQEALKLTQFSVDHAVEGFFWVGPDARILHVNDTACRLLEYTREELTAMTVHDFDPNFPPEVWSAHWAELKEKGSLTFESRHWTRTGRVLDTEVTVNYLQYEGKEYNCAIMRDIGERKRAEEALRESHSFLRQVLDINPNFIFAKDRDGRFTLVNKTLADAYGATVDELIGKTDVDFNANRKEVAFFREKDLEVMDTLQDIFIPEEVVTDSMGIPHWVQTVKRPILDEQGRATMVLSTATDITNRKRLEETLRQGEHDLRAALQERVRISQDLHDGILQSLFAVGLTLEVSKSLMSPQVRKKSGASLDQAIDQLNRVMQEIRNFIAGIGSDLLQGKDLPAALQLMLDSLRKHQAMCVRLKVEDRAARALSAEQCLHLFLVIQEAVSNCIRHGHAQEARVSLKMLKQVVRLSIRDNGRGFDQETAKGTGHGLSNMAARARKIGGRFTVLSKVNEGTRIVLDLPKEAPDVLR